MSYSSSFSFSFCHGQFHHFVCLVDMSFRHSVCASYVGPVALVFSVELFNLTTPQVFKMKFMKFANISVKLHYHFSILHHADPVFAGLDVWALCLLFSLIYLFVVLRLSSWHLLPFLGLCELASDSFQGVGSHIILTNTNTMPPDVQLPS